MAPWRLRAVPLWCLLWPVVIGAQAYTVTPITTPRPKDPTYALPLVPDRTMRFTTDEGTAMSLDISPDGKTIVFDLLGDLYTVPMTGGKATRIMGGMAMDFAPRYSPDGTRIVFVSDRSGMDNLWLADADGQHPRPALAALDTGRGVENGGDKPGITERAWDPVWTPDGQGILSNGQRFSLGGSNRGLPMPTLEGIEDSPYEPLWATVAFGRDPHHAYLSNGQGMVLYDFVTRRATPSRLRVGRGKVVVSPNNRWLAYRAKGVGANRYGLRLRDLRTGAERWLVQGIGADGPLYLDEPYAGRREVFTPDSRSLVFTDRGKFWRVDLVTGQRTPIPFLAEVEQDLGPFVRFPHSAVQDTLTVREIREAQLSPDGKQLAFIALGKLYLMDFPQGTPRRVTLSSGVSESGPAWSPDGRYLAYATYSDAGEGYLYRVAMTQRAFPAPERLTQERAIYVAPAYSPDGKRLACIRLSWRALRDEMNYAGAPEELVWLDADGGTPRAIMPVALSDSRHRRAPPQFLTADTAHVFIGTFDEKSKTRRLVSVRWDGTDRRVVLSVPDEFTNFNAAAVLAPEGRHALLTSRHNLYLVRLPGLPDSLHIDVQAPLPSVPVRRISRTGGMYPAWRADGQQFSFTNGHAFFLYDVARGDSLMADRPVRYDINVRVPRDTPRGTIALRGARLLTMRDHEVIERGDLVIRDSRILAVGAFGRVPIPPEAQVVDVSGKTIIPGYVDLHDHIHTWDTSHPVQYQQLPSYLSRLAYGVTLSRDPHVREQWASYGDRVETGDILGPRILPTGDASYEDFESLADVRERVRRRLAFYGEQTYKMYDDGSRLVRQWVAIALRELQVAPTAHDNFPGPVVIAKMIDGYAGNEHNYFRAGAHRDFTLLAAATSMSFSHLAGEWHDLTFAQHLERDARSRWDPLIAQGAWGAGRPAFYSPEGDETRGMTAGRFAARMAAVGGLIAVGAHGDEPGLGTALEMQSIGRFMPPYDALRTGTINGARAIGLDGDVGSLEPGKLADLQILHKNPLDDLRHIHTVYRIMKNGRLYDPATLDELWPRQQKFGWPHWWWIDVPPSSTPRAPR